VPKPIEVDRDAIEAGKGKPGGLALKAARDSLRLGCVCGGVGGAIFLLCVWLAYRHAAVPVTFGCAAFMLVAAFLYLSAGTRWMRARWMPAAGAVLSAAMAASQVYAFLLVRSPSFTVFMVLLVLGSSVIHSDLRWVVVSQVLAVGAWLVCGFSMFGSSFVVAAGVLTISSLIAVIVHIMMWRYLRSIATLRERDRQLQVELAAALEAAQRELVDRKRAEAERERLREQLLHSQKLEAIGTLAGGVAHDMNNVLAAIIGLAEQMGGEGPAPDGVDQILEAARRGTELTRNLLGFSRRGKYRKEQLELSGVVATVTQLLSRTLPKGIEFTSATTTTRVVEGDSAQLAQALVNVCLNSADAMSGSGTLSIEVGESALAGEAASAMGLPEGCYVTLTVRDSGCGMDRETQARMFEPFFTTKAQARRTGLGLAMVYGTIANHGGAIAVESAPGRGTMVRLHLPAVERTERAEPPPAAPTRQAGHGALILVVDDEPMVRHVTQRSLERAGYEVITASHGGEAVERFQERGEDVSVVVLDMSMPIMGGAECFHRLRALAPGVRVLLASGYALEQEARACLAAGALGFLEKPFPTRHLLEAVALAGSDQPLHQSLSVPPVL
jgi:signal transduction histidine kinase/CheY-like chemotaxis protein